MQVDVVDGRFSVETLHLTKDVEVRNMDDTEEESQEHIVAFDSCSAGHPIVIHNVFAHAKCSVDERVRCWNIGGGTIP